jgi:hypothetical protein
MAQFFNAARRKFLALGLGAMASTLYFSAQGAATKHKKSVKPVNPSLGINLTSLADWNSELPFVDLMRMSRDWISVDSEGAWGKGPALNLDENGWVTSLQKGYRALRILSSLPAGQYPSGVYTILYDGEGEISAPNGRLTKQAAGMALLKIDAKKDGFTIEITKTNPQNYLRNIRVIMPGFAASYDTNPWHPIFLQRWQGIACIRFMDWMLTNNSSQSQWKTRPKLSHASFANNGVPVELMLDLANRLNADAWFCMPHLADDDYTLQFALVVKDKLKPNLKAWLEYSNEVWNGGFEQHKYAAQQGLALRLDKESWTAALRFNAHRSTQMFNIWSTVFTGSQQLVRVLASQAVSSYSAEQILNFNQSAKNADALAIAPYVSVIVQPTAEDGMTDKRVANWSLDKLFAHIQAVSLPDSSLTIKNNKIIADTHGLKLVAYESGQHLVGVAGAENNEKLTQLFIAANADTRMGDVYAKSLQAWQQFGGDLNCTFNSVGGWSKWGSWGLLRYYNDKPTAKFKAVIEWAISRGQKMVL